MQTEVVSVAPWMHTEVLLPFSKFPKALALLCLACTEKLWEQGIVLLRAQYKLMPLPVLLAQNSLVEYSLRKVGKMSLQALITLFCDQVDCNAQVR